VSRGKRRVRPLWLSHRLAALWCRCRAQVAASQPFTSSSFIGGRGASGRPEERPREPTPAPDATHADLQVARSDPRKAEVSCAAALRCREPDRLLPPEPREQGLE